MARFAANLTYLFTELPMLQRFAAARRAGFDGVEILFPYDLPARDLLQAARENRLSFVLMNTPPPNWAGGPRGFAAEPGNEARFRSDFDRALRYAETLNVAHLHVMAGKAEGDEARETFLRNLEWACTRAPGISLTIEPMNRNDIPGYFLDSFDLAGEIIDEIDQPNLGLQFDAYQAHMIHGDVIQTWERHARNAVHIQIAGSPGRHEPRAGEINYAGFFRAVDAAGFRGWVGAEYTPLTSTEAGLRWLRSA
jgi:hydroxypyruvate isomerase